MKVLVVDDVGYSRIIAQKALERSGHTILTASSGPEALRHLRHESDIALVLCDLMMPDMDGIQLLEKTQQLERASDEGVPAPPPFILLTACQERSLLQKAQNAGFVDIMVKPLDPERLLKTIEELPGKKPAEE